MSKLHRTLSELLARQKALTARNDDIGIAIRAAISYNCATIAHLDVSHQNPEGPYTDGVQNLFEAHSQKATEEFHNFMDAMERLAQCVDK